MFRAYDPGRDRLVALKIFRLDLQPERLNKLVAELEALIAAGLTHPVIATPRAAGVAETSAYLAQDFVAADSLDIVARERGSVLPSDAIRVVTELAAALDHAAARNVAHGGLHPRDVLVSSESTRLTGVGITRALERAGVAAPSRRPYAAPERVAGGRWDRRADVFSLAALAFELLWGRRVTGIGDQAARGAMPLAGADLQALRRVFGRALARDPEDRFDRALAFAEALAAALGAAQAGVQPAPSAPPVEVSRSSASAPPAVASRRARDGRRAPIEAGPGLPLDDAPVEAAGVGSSVFDADPAASRVAPPVDDLELFEAPAAYADIEQGLKRAEPSEGRVSAAPRTLRADALRVETSGVSVLMRVAAGAPVPSDADPVVAHTPREPTRSAIWPLALALVLGLSVGFAGGYGLGSRDRPDPNKPSSSGLAVPLAPTAVGPSAHESAERSPGDQSKPPASGSAVGVHQNADGAVGPASRADSKPGAAPAAPTASRQSDVPPSPRSANIGSLLVRSTPAGARAWLDGRAVGVTPVSMRDLAFGSYTIRVSLDGYVAKEGRVVIRRKRAAQSIAFELATPTTPASAVRYAGVLVVDSRPAGVNVLVDGKPVGKTPLELDSVDPGEHTIRLEQDGYRRWTSSVRVVAGERIRVTASLER